MSTFKHRDVIGLPVHRDYILEQSFLSANIVVNV